MCVWQRIQDRIWECTACDGQSRVELNIRQQTDPPPVRTALLVISLAPPFGEDVKERTKAPSATTSGQDKLRLFLEEALGAKWQTLTDRGVILLHAVKCAIRPIKGGFQNPPASIVDRCAPVHLAAELRQVGPEVVVALGRMAYRALRIAVGDEDLQLMLSSPPKAAMPGQAGYPLCLHGRSMILYTSRFPPGSGRKEAMAVIRRAAAAARIVAGEF